MTLRPRLELLRDIGQHDDRWALIGPDGPVTYARLAMRVAEVAQSLGGDRRLVLLAAGNSIDAIVHYLAALAAGHVVLLSSGDPAVQQRLVATYAPDLVVHAAGGPVEVVHRRTGTNHVLHPELALLLSTSGSTGSPKLVRLSYTNLQSNAEAIAAYLGLTPDDRAMTSLPVHYCYGLSVLHSHLAIGASLVVTDTSVVDECFWNELRRWSATSFAAVPHTFELLDRIGFDRMEVPSLRCITQAGGKMPPATVARYARLGRDRGWELFVMYGQTEATARMAYLPPHLAETHPTAIGIPIPGGAFTVEPCEEAAGPEEGELSYQGPNVMLGYATQPSHLARGRDLDRLRTGDLARRRPDGLYEIVGRRSRYLKLFGLRVDLDHAETQLAEHGVTATCAGDDARLVVAVADPGHEPSVREVLNHRLGLPHSSVHLTVLRDLPRLSNGKVDHRAIVRSAPPLQRPQQDLPEKQQNTADAVRVLYAQTLGLDSVDPAATFVGLGGDSLSYIEISIGLEEILGHVPPQWHTTPITHLLPAEGGAPAPRLETSILLRAMAIVMVVGTHAGLFDLLGGAHLLLGVAGFTFARFQLGALRESGSARLLSRSIGRIAVPSIATIALLAVTSGGYGWTTLALVNSHFGPDTWDQRWRFWYIEALIQILALAAVALSFRRTRDLELSYPFLVPVTVFALGLAIRFATTDPGTGILSTHRPQTVLWIFALGWAAERATTTPKRLLITVAVLTTVPGFFGNPTRAAIVAVGLLLLLWVPAIPVTTPLRRPISAIAAASLWIYLTHWFIYRAISDHTSPLLAVMACVAAGLLVHRSVNAAPATLRRIGAHLRPAAPDLVWHNRPVEPRLPLQQG